MPNNIVKGLADKSNKSIKEVEKLWNDAKNIAEEELGKKEKDFNDYDWKYVTGILKNMLDIKESYVINFLDSDMNAKQFIETVISGQFSAIQDSPIQFKKNIIDDDDDDDEDEDDEEYNENPNKIIKVNEEEINGEKIEVESCDDLNIGDKVQVVYDVDTKNGKVYLKQKDGLHHVTIIKVNFNDGSAQNFTIKDLKTVKIYKYV